MFWIGFTVGTIVTFFLILAWSLCLVSRKSDDLMGEEEKSSLKIEREEVEEYINEKNLILRSDKHFRGKVKIEHLDKSKLELENALLEEKDKFIIVFTEHLNNFYFDKEDLEKWEYKEY